MSEKITFQIQRADFVAMSVAVARRPWPFRLASVVATLSLMVFGLSVLQSNDPDGRSMLYDALKGQSDWYPFYAFVLLVVVGLIFRHQLRGLNAAAGYARMPLADAEMTVEVGAEEMHVTAPAVSFDWTVPRLAVRALIETPAHLVVAVGAKEGVPVPRRAFADDKAWTRFRDALIAFLPEGAAHDRT